MSFQEIFRTARTFSLLVLLGVGIFSIGFRAKHFLVQGMDSLQKQHLLLQPVINYRK
jgi:hypothetical protein